jgi:hypothetical protein
MKHRPTLRRSNPNGRVVDIELETSTRRAKSPSHDIRDMYGRLSFRTAEGKEVRTGGIAFVAKGLLRSIL